MYASARRRKRHGGGHEDGERWLLTYADMITLLLALFMLLFSISAVNVSKYRTLQKALKDAFSGQILPGGRHLENTGASEQESHVPETMATTNIMNFGEESASQTETQTQPHSAAETAVSSEEASLRKLESTFGSSQAAAQAEQSDFRRVQREIQAYAASHGLQSSVTTKIEPRGLVISLLTDKLLFASGQATLSPGAYPLLKKLAGILDVDSVHPIAVEGDTDDVPIDTPAFPSNWQLSTARADTIVQYLIANGVAAHRLSAVGYGEQRPIASNATAAGRAHNRRVDIVLERLYPDPNGG